MFVKAWRFMVLGAGIIGSVSAFAQYQILSVTGTYSQSAETHLLIAGAPNELQDGIFDAATTRAFYLNGAFPNRQVLVVLPSEPFSNMDEKVRLATEKKYGLVEGAREIAWAKESGLKVVAKSGNRLGRSELLRVALNFRKVRSFEIFGHSGWTTGAAIGSKKFDERFPFAYPMLQNYRPGSGVEYKYFEPGIQELGNRFTDDGYAIIWGCNSGWTIAPMLSALWRVPVLGSLTFADFEALHKDGNYYMRDYGYPTGEQWGAWPWASKNEVSFPANPLPCGRACTRMKPNNFPYTGVWGNYNRVVENGRTFEGGGLGFMKAFCNFPQGRRQVGSSGGGLFGGRPVATFEPALQSCYRGLGHFMIANVSNMAANDDGFVAYKFRLLDFMCPNDNRDGKFTECVNKLEESEFTQLKGYSSFKGNPLNCDLLGCYADFNYTPGIQGSPGNAYGIEQKTVRVSTRRNSADSSLEQFREYHHYLKAYHAYTGHLPQRLKLYGRVAPSVDAKKERLPAQTTEKSPKIDDDVASETVTLTPPPETP